MKLDDFKAKISGKGGTAQSNYYEIIVNSPAGGDSNSVAMMCDSVVMPGRSIATTEYNQGKQTLKTPYTFIDSEVTASFIMTNDGLARNYFADWIEFIMPANDYTVKYKDQYARDITIRQLNKNGDVVYAVTLQGAYPSNLNEYTLSNSEENSVTKVEVTFVYDKFVKS